MLKRFQSDGTAPVSMKLAKFTGCCAFLAADLFFMASGIEPDGSEHITVTMSIPPSKGV